MYSLSKLLKSPLNVNALHLSPIFTAPNTSFLLPGYWVACTAKARKLSCLLHDLPLDSAHIEYAKALGIEAALGQVDTYAYERLNAGKNYSPLVVLASELDADRASQAINNCIRTMFPEESLKAFVRDLCDVVGDLHDNVWSHGESTGISAAQKWLKPKTQGKEHCIEFALADCGMGFLRELQRSGIASKFAINSDDEAIAWCIEKGNSSKKKKIDEWAQSLPSDMMGNPLGKHGVLITKENHHQGLGLHKLITFVFRYAGNLTLASGNAMLSIDNKGKSTYFKLDTSWEGVAISCRFSTDSVRKHHVKDDLPEAELDTLLRDIFS